LGAAGAVHKESKHTKSANLDFLRGIEGNRSKFSKTMDPSPIIERNANPICLWRLDLQCLELVRALKETARLGNSLFTENPRVTQTSSFDIRTA
jgi:hypothetical protein